VSVKEGLPTVRTYKVVQTGTKPRVFSLAGSSTSPEDYLLTKLTGKLVGVKIAPLLEEVQVFTQ
jgi:hypothetical protein